MKRFFSAIIMLPLILLVFLCGNQYVIDIFISMVAIICMREIFNAFEKKGYHPITWLGYLAAISICFLHIIPKEHALILIGSIIPITILVSFVLVILKKTKTDVIDIAITFFSVCYIVIFLMFVSIIRQMNNGIFFIWYVFIASWVTDIFAYETGQSIGKHKYTDISPHKTIEGCIGGTIGSVLSAVAFTLILNTFFGFNINVLVIIIGGALLSIIGQIGDLSASAIKRYVGIKDFSDLIPGHGGMLDRIDSLLFIAPFAYLMLLLI